MDELGGGSKATLPEIKLASFPAAMRALDNLDADIRNAPTLDVLNVLIDIAAGLQRRWKPVKDVADRAGKCWVDAEIKLGDELASVPKAKGTRGQKLVAGPGRGKKEKTGGAVVDPPVLDSPTRAELGVGKKQAARAGKLAAMPSEVQEARIASAKAQLFDQLHQNPQPRNAPCRDN